MSQQETHVFQAEIKQLLDIVIHSLYTEKEIFIRELISNATDAIEKVRFQQTSGTEVRSPSLPLKISVTTDETARTITIADTGVGMTKQELIDNLGTIARSGSKEFMAKLGEVKADQRLDLIGQFGVGFYSAFMVADKVDVYTCSAKSDEPSWHWSSTGSGSFDIEEAEGLDRGTKIVVNLREDQKEYATSNKVEEIVKRYSNFVPFPIELNGTTTNKVQALWAKSKSEIKEEEYNEFYQFISHDYQPPAYRLHFNADAPLSIKALLFTPQTSLERMGLTRTENEVSLYCRKVLIQPKAKNLFPEWLRFLKGVVDCEDLPLNISRETMQDSALLAKLNQVMTARYLKMLDEEAKKDAEKYAKFYNEFSHHLKEGVVRDDKNREALGKLLRFESSSTEPGKTTSLADYVSRMGSEQKDIYALLASSREAAEGNPNYEVFKARKIEVLFMYEHHDEFVMEHLRTFDGKKLTFAEKADLALDEPVAKEDAKELDADQARALANFIKETLGERVEDVRSSKRLVDSPAVVAESDPGMTSSMRRMMKAMSKEARGMAIRPHMEINPRHPLIVQLYAIRQQDAVLAGQVSEQLFDNALIAAGLLEDPRYMLQRLNGLLTRVLGGEVTAPSPAAAANDGATTGDKASNDGGASVFEDSAENVEVKEVPVEVEKGS
ncbi:MAG: molecular chaperone HtpG [Candidatus Methylacidiphilales bacterium]|nr:molecular chaperone HtpG [Candidatus Methylacidiphilales bacterium]